MIKFLAEKYSKTLKLFERFRLYFFIPLFIFILLFIKDPFSDRSLVPNFEPFPDSFHYLLPARCFITTGSWTLCRPGMVGRTPDVGPLYSIIFIPFFLVFNDPRMFFFANVTLAIGSFYLLHKILFNLKINSLIQFCVLLIAATRYHLYWFPSLAMAENLLLFLFLLNIWIVQQKQIWLKLIGIIAAVGFYAAKYAYAPLTAVFLFIHVLMIFQHRKRPAQWVLVVAGMIGITLLLLLLRAQFILSLFSSTFFLLRLTETQAQGTWFSLAFVGEHFRQYLAALLGAPSLVLWDTRALFPWYLSWVSLIGLVVGLWDKRFRIVSAITLVGIFSQMLFISSFYAFDARYILHSVYSLLIGLAIGLAMLSSSIKKVPKEYMQLAIVALTLVLILTQAKALKSQVAVNLKYAETPWYYVATKEIDNSLTKYDGRKVLISAMPVYFFDFFGSNNYVVLPMSQEQERKQKSMVYGEEYNYENLPGLYKEFLTNGNLVFVSNYGLGNEGYMHENYQHIFDSFNTTLISEGCYGACNVYQLTIND